MSADLSYPDRDPELVSLEQELLEALQARHLLIVESAKDNKNQQLRDEIKLISKQITALNKCRMVFLESS